MKLKQFSSLFLILFSLFTTGSLLSQTVNKDFFDGEIYVKYNDDFAIDFSQQFVEPQSLVGLNEELVKEYGITQARFSFNKIPNVKLQRTVRIKFTEFEKAEILIKHFEQLPYIKYAEKIPVVRPTYTPNDFGQNKYNDAWHLHKINATKAWDFTKGDTNITVAVVDQEVDINHVDLKDNIWTNPNEIPNNGIDDDNNGYIDDIHGWDISDNDNNPTNYNNSNLNHGTPCAGLAGAVTNNQKGISSIGFNIRIIAIKISRNSQSNNLLYESAEGIAYAGVIKSDVISCSYGSDSRSNTEQNAINFAMSKGSIVVAAAGNESKTFTGYPSSYPGVISVAASDISDKKASFSNYGNRIDVIGPGVGTRTLNRNNQYTSFSGTSASCPITAGLLGLMKSHMPTISNTDLRQCLLNSADNIDNLNLSYTGQLGSGRINAERALQCVDSVKKSPPTISVSLNKNYICPLEKTTLSVSSHKRPLDSATWYIYKKDTIETLKGQHIETTFGMDSVYSISVVGYDKYGKDSIHQSQYIHVNSLYNTVYYLENFEGKAPNFSFSNPDNGPSWGVSNAQKATLNKAMKMDFFNSKSIGQRDAFTLPPINLNTALTPLLTFHYSYSSAFSSDSLIIYASTDSGKSFPRKVYSVGLGRIETATIFNNKAFTPNATNQWCVLNTVKCPNISLSQLAEEQNVILKFETFYGGGNNLYLDDIKVFTNCGEFISSPPISGFTSIDTIICLGDSLQFSATSTSFPETYQWVLEGAIPDTAYGLNPKAKYSQTGTYDVTLITFNVLGSDTIIKEDYVRVASPPKVSVSDTLKYVCPKDSVFFTALGADSIVWLNINTNKLIVDSVLGDKPIQNTFYQAKAITKEGCFDTVTVKAVLVPLPPNVTLYQKIDSLEAIHSAGNFTYRWFINDTLTSLYVTKTIKPYKTANYKVEIIDSAGCTRISNNMSISTVGINQPSFNNINIYPNPTKRLLNISGLNKKNNASITITDILGRMVFSAKVKHEKETIDVSSFSKGLYFIKITQGEQSSVQKIIVE